MSQRKYKEELKVHLEGIRCGAVAGWYEPLKFTTSLTRVTCDRCLRKRGKLERKLKEFSDSLKGEE